MHIIYTHMWSPQLSLMLYTSDGVSASGLWAGITPSTVALDESSSTTAKQHVHVLPLSLSAQKTAEYLRNACNSKITFAFKCLNGLQGHDFQQQNCSSLYKVTQFFLEQTRICINFTAPHDVLSLNTGNRSPLFNRCTLLCLLTVLQFPLNTQVANRKL